MSYLPANNLDPTPIQKGDSLEPDPKGINNVVPLNPNKPYDMHEVISKITDCGSFFEIHKNYAPNILVGFARMNGRRK